MVLASISLREPSNGVNGLADSCNVDLCLKDNIKEM